MKVDLQTGNIKGRYYNAQPLVTFNCPWDIQSSHKKSNQQIPPLVSSDPHQDQASVAKCEMATPEIKNNQLDMLPKHNIERPYLNQIPLQQNMDRQIHDMDSTTKTQMTWPKEDRFNESIITLMSGQQDLQKITRHDEKYVEANG